jgi:hypothetical protein
MLFFERRPWRAFSRLCCVLLTVHHTTTLPHLRLRTQETTMAHMAQSRLLARVTAAFGRGAKCLLLLTSFFAVSGFSAPASASVSCPQLSFGSWIQGTSGAWAKYGTLTADGLAKTCVNGSAATGSESLSIIGTFAAPGPGPSAFGILSVNFSATTGGVSQTLTATCSGSCTASGNGAYIQGTGTATVGVSYVDITGQSVSATVNFDAGTITVSSFSIIGGVYDSTGPIVATVSPATGSPAGGTTVTLSGSGYTGATAVKFGNAPAQSFSVVSPTSISAVAPPGAVGAVNVSVTSASGTASLPNAFTYVLQPQATVSVIASPTVISVGSTSNFSASGGSGTGAISYALTLGASACTLSGTTLTAIAPGSCRITATRAADAVYAAATGFAMVTVSTLNQAPLTATAYPNDIAVGQTTTPVVSGGSGTGAYSRAITSGNSFCTLSGAVITGTAAGTCTVTITKAGDGTYNPTTATVDIAVGKTAQAALTVSASPAAPTLGMTSNLATSGGSGTGAVSYRIANVGAGCTLSGSTVTMVGASACSIMAIKDSDATFAAATALVLINVGGLTQNPLTLTANPTALAVGGTTTLTTSGGSGAGALAYSASNSPGVCALTGNVVTALAVGQCSIYASKAPDATYAPAYKNLILNVVPGPQAVLTVAAAPSAMPVGSTSKVTAMGGSGAGNITYAVTAGGNFCMITGTGAIGVTVSGTAAGVCTVTATKAGDLNYLSTTGSVNVTVGKSPQAALTASAALSTIAYNGTSALSVSGGSGTGIVSYAVTAGGTFCSVSGSTLTGIGVGACTVTATKASDATYAAATATVNVTVGQGAQAALTAAAAPATIGVNSTSALSITGGSGTGAVTYVVTAGPTICNVSGANVTGTTPGLCTITATKAGDNNYTAKTATVDVTVTKGTQAGFAAQASPTSIAVADTSALASTGGSGTGAVTYAITSGAAFCSVTGTTVTAIAAGTCTVTATRAADTNFNAVTATVSITVGKAAQAALTAAASPNLIPVTGSSALSVTGGSGTGAVTYAVTVGAANCSVTGATVRGSAAGLCTITATKAGDANYGLATASVDITVGKAAQSLLTAVAMPLAVSVNAISALSTIGGSGAGAVTYAVIAGASVCSITGTTLRGSSVGTCTVTATKAGDAMYLDATGTVDVTVGKAVQAPLTLAAAPTTLAANGTSVLAVTGGSGTGPVSYAVTSGAANCAITGNALTALAAGTCSVTATKSGDTNYIDAAASTTLTVTRANQVALAASASPTALVTNETSLLATSGGSGSGAITYTVAAGPTVCSISGSTLRALASGSCTVLATKAADAVYNPATSTVTLSVTKATQAALTASATPTAIALGATSTLSVAGGFGSGAVTYAVTAGPTICSVVGTTLRGNANGTCTVTATKAADPGYTAATATVTVTVGKVTQAVLIPTATPTSVVIGNNSTLGTSGGSGTGAVSFAVTTGTSVCAVSGSTLTGIGLGTCTVTATKAGDTTYGSTTAQTLVVVTGGTTPQAALTASASPAAIFVNGTSALGVSGGSGGGGVSYTVTTGSNICALSGTTLTGLAAGTCTVTATKAGDTTYLAATSIVSVTITKASQAILSASATPAAIVFNGTSALGVSGGSGLGAVSYTVSAGASVCALTGTSLRGIGVGTCTITALKAADAAYDAASATIDVSVSKSPQTAFTLVASPASLLVNGVATLSTSGGAGVGTVSYTVTSGASQCTLAGNQLTATAIGSCTVTATKGADANYDAINATAIITVRASGQTVSFARPGAQSFASGATVALSASASSGLSVTLTSSTPAACTISGTTATIVAPGTCTITATQLGNANYAAASPVTQSFVINGLAASLTLSASATTIEPGKTVSFTAKVSPASATGSITFKSGATTLCAAVTPVAGSARCDAALPSGAHAVTAVFDASGAYASATSVPLALNVGNPVAKSADAAGRFMAQRSGLIINNLFNGERQVDRLQQADAATRGGVALASAMAAVPQGGASSGRSGAGVDINDLARMRFGIRPQTTPGAEIALRQSAFDDDAPATTPGVRGPVDLTGSTDGASRFAVSTSLSQIARQNSERNRALGVQEGVSAPIVRSPFNPVDVWLDAKYSSFRDKSVETGNDGHFSNLGMGTDYVINRWFLLGAFVQFDSMRQASTVMHSEARGTGWLAGPYATLKLSENVFWQVRAGWGRAKNEVSPNMATTDSFNSDRRMAATTLAGRWSNGPWLLQPAVTVSYIEDSGHAYVDAAGVSVPGVTSRLGQAKAGPVISYKYEPSPGMIIEPRLSLHVIWDLASETTAAGLGSLVAEQKGSGAGGRSELGLRAMTPSGITMDMSGSYDGIGSSTVKAVSGRASLAVPLH